MLSIKKCGVILTLVMSAVAFAQKVEKKPIPVLHEVSNREVVQSIFPNATKVDKVNDYWFKILDDKAKVIGFAMSSMPYCKDVIGYNNTTPVMIITDAKYVVKKVAILTNWETLGYVKKLERKGFFNLWNDKTIKEAQTVQLDGYTGATKTAKAIGVNIDFLLSNGSRKLPVK